MKKHVSLFLALLMVFSFLFATSVEAAQLKQDKTEKMYHNTNEVIARANASVEPPSDGIHGVSNDDPIPGGGGCTAHVFRSQYLNSGYHRLICVNCGYTKTASHAFGSPVKCSEEQHKQKCTVCGYTKKTNHLFIGTKISATQHIETCADCGYSKVASEDSYNPPVYYTASRHKETCQVCGYTRVVGHKYERDKARELTPVDPGYWDDYEQKHIVPCACGHTININHTWVAELCYTGMETCYYCKQNRVIVNVPFNP